MNRPSPWRAPFAALPFWLPALLFYGAFVLLPILLTAWYSLLDWNPPEPARWAGTANYLRLFRDGAFWRALGHNLELVGLSLVIQLPVALTIALLLDAVRRGRGLLRAGFFLPMILPTVVIARLWIMIYYRGAGTGGLLQALFSALGVSAAAQPDWLGDPRLALYSLIVSISWRYVGFHAVILLAGLATIPQELYEAAAVDGAGRWPRFRHVTWPLLRPALYLSATLSVLGSLRYFDLVWIMTVGGPFRGRAGGASELVTTYIYRTGISPTTNMIEIGYAAAMAVVLLLVALLAAGLVRAGFRRRGPGAAGGPEVVA